MKKLVITLMLMLGLIVGFNAVETNAATIKLNAKKVTLKVGKSKTIKLKGVSKTDIKAGKVLWGSDNPSVADVDQTGKITAKGKGTTYVRAFYNDNNYKCKVTVKKSSSKSSKNTVIKLRKITYLVPEDYTKISERSERDYDGIIYMDKQSQFWGFVSFQFEDANIAQGMKVASTNKEVFETMCETIGSQFMAQYNATDIKCTVEETDKGYIGYVESIVSMDGIECNYVMGLRIVNGKLCSVFYINMDDDTYAKGMKTLKTHVLNIG